MKYIIKQREDGRWSVFEILQTKESICSIHIPGCPWFKTKEEAGLLKMDLLKENAW